MRKLFVLSALLVTTGSVFSWSNVNQLKPGTTVTTTVSVIKLAEAKAALSKANTRNSKNLLGTADGGI
jgi:hypothetical protein